MRPFTGWLVTGAVALAVGAGHAAAQAGTCYDATLGPWTPIEGSARTQEGRRPPPDESSDSLFCLFPPRILLSERPVERGSEERFVIVVPEDALTVPKSSLAWRIDGDSLGVWVMDRTSGVRGWASRTNLGEPHDPGSPPARALRGPHAGDPHRSAHGALTNLERR